MALWHRYVWIAYVAVFLGVLGHATTEFVAVLSGVAGPPLSVWRFVLGGLGLVVVSLLIPASRDLITPLRQAFWPIMGLSLFWFALGYLAFHLSLDFATVPQVATTVTAAPIFVAILNLWWNDQPIGVAKWVTGVAAVFGVALLVTDGALNQLTASGRSLFGLMLAICCAALVGGYTLFARPVIGRFGALRIVTVTTVIGALGLWLVVGVFWGEWVNPVTLFDRPAGAAHHRHLEHHAHAVAVARRPRRRAGHHPRHLPLLPQAGDRRGPGALHPGPAGDMAAAARDLPDHRLRRPRSLLAPPVRL